MPTPIIGTNAMSMHVKDINKARQFYTNVVGLKEANFDAAQKVAYFEVPNSPVLAVHEWSGFCMHGPMEGRPPGTVSGIIFHVNDTTQAANDLKKKGATISFGPEKTPMGTVIAAVKDPDGNEFVLSTRPGA